MRANTVHRTVTIASGGTTSEAFDVSGELLAGIICPAEFDGTTITFTASDEPAGTFLACYATDGTAISVTTAASRHVLLEPQTFAGARFIKLVAGTAQTGDTEVTLVLVQEA